MTLTRKIISLLDLLILFVLIPFLLGIGIAVYSNPLWIDDLLSPFLLGNPSKPPQRRILQAWHEACYQEFLKTMKLDDQSDNLDWLSSDLSISLHRNGEAQPCEPRSINATTLRDSMQQAMASLESCPDWKSKYVAEAYWTRVLARAFPNCASTEPDRSKRTGLYGFCDMGPSKTPLLYDHSNLIPIPAVEVNDFNNNKNNTPYLPCHFHTTNGRRLFSMITLGDWIRGAQETCPAQDDCSTTTKTVLELYAVPAGRHFMFAPKYVGEIIPLDHVTGGDPHQPVYLQVLSLSPRVFDLVNFFSKQESNELVERAHQETSESHRIKRSSTGASGYNLNQHRTSESGYDTVGKTAMNIKRRCFGVLGMDQYVEKHADGLQILRYNLTTAYNTHMDWIEGSDSLEHNFEASGQGSNRFATIILYMSDLGENDGGETVFTKAWPDDVAPANRLSREEATAQLRESGSGKVLEEGSWEERLAAMCRSRLAIRPNSARSVLFYSQHPNGQEDKSSLHGACPILSGTKYAANLWVWNAVRHGYSDSPKNPRYKKRG